jgi:protein-L-isoaspartate(D-aspartate) O-methyltransferase
VTRTRRPAGFPASLQTEASTPGRPGLLRPQKTLQEAARDASRAVPPSGLGLDSAQVRSRMVERLRREGGVVEPVLAALEAVPRHRFVDSALATQAYEDTSLPIGLGQTISKPSVVARMLSLLWLRPGARLARGADGPGAGSLGRVLEIGTGCGYQAALISLLASRVVSVERLGPLHDKARRTLRELGFHDLTLLHRDGHEGYPPSAPYDTIISAAGGADIPTPWKEQLAVGGRLVAPVHSDEHGGQILRVLDRDADGWHVSHHDAVHFVPLKSGTL